MTLPEISINRHVLAWMLSAVLVPGANPEIVDASITNLIETAVNAVPGIEHVQSDSSPGASVVRITFQLTKDIDVAFNEVQAWPRSSSAPSLLCGSPCKATVPSSS